MTDEAHRLTTSGSSPIPDDRNPLTAGPRGPLLVQDGHHSDGTMREVPAEIIERQLAHFDKADPQHGQLVRAALA
jgi:catalase